MNNIKLSDIQNFSIKCKPATIRKCNGCILEILTVQPQRKEIFDSLMWFKENGYRIYYLRHKDNDMSTPSIICQNSIFINRFGFFVTKDRMKFHECGYHNSVRLTVRNINYYSNDKDGYSNVIESTEYAFDLGMEISVYDFITNYDELVWSMKKVKSDEVLHECGIK